MPDHALPTYSSPLAALLGRASVPATLLRDPGPDGEAFATAVAAAMRAPDHGGLRVWRYVRIAGEARRALGDLLATSFAARDPAGATPERLAIERAKPLRAPVVIAAGAALRPDHAKIPVWEQEASAAAGSMNLLNALDAMGFGAIWLSSPALRDPAIKAALGFAPTDALHGWIYAGTPDAARPRPQRTDPAVHWRDWRPGSTHP